MRLNEVHFQIHFTGSFDHSINRAVDLENHRPAMVNVKCSPKTMFFLAFVITFVTVSAIIAVLASAPNVADDSNEATLQEPKGGKGRSNVEKELCINMSLKSYDNSFEVG